MERGGDGGGERRKKVSKARAASVASGSGALETDGGNRDRMGDASAQ